MLLGVAANKFAPAEIPTSNPSVFANSLDVENASASFTWNNFIKNICI